MKVSIYCRVSTVDQSVEMQRSDLRRYCEQRSFEIFREYVDEGVSGTKDRRPALDPLMEDARKRLFDGVVCWRFDRFARSTKHLISALDEFQHLGVEFISYQENIDTGSSLGKAMFTIVAAIAELERNIIVERIRGGIRRAREQGTRLGRRPFTDPSLLRTVLQIKAQGRSIRAIAETVKVSKSFVHKTCKNSGPQTLEIPAGQN
jgi:DNA invertase Pin-like site-specific DNA recombinase